MLFDSKLVCIRVIWNKVYFKTLRFDTEEKKRSNVPNRKPSSIAKIPVKCKKWNEEMAVVIKDVHSSFAGSKHRSHYHVSSCRHPIMYCCNPPIIQFSQPLFYENVWIQNWTLLSVFSSVFFAYAVSMLAAAIGQIIAYHHQIILPDRLH